MQQYKGKRILKNGAIGAYVLQSNSKYLWRIIGHTKSKKKQSGGAWGALPPVVQAGGWGGPLPPNFLEGGTKSKKQKGGWGFVPIKITKKKK